MQAQLIRRMQLKDFLMTVRNATLLQIGVVQLSIIVQQDLRLLGRMQLSNALLAIHLVIQQRLQLLAMVVMLLIIIIQIIRRTKLLVTQLIVRNAIQLQLLLRQLLIIQLISR